MPNGNPVCLLALEEKPNSFLPIDLNAIGFEISSKKLTMSDIDNLSMKYDEILIREKIRKANVVPAYAMAAKLVLLYEEEGQKRKAPFISKVMFDENNINELMIENIDDKNFVNQLIIKIRNLKVPEYLELTLIDCLKHSSATYFMQAFISLSYILQRKLYLYMITIAKRDINSTRVREKEGE